MPDTREHEHWSSQWLFVMATIGASVGLANIWRFPFSTGQNGGGAFVLIYLVAVVFMALPLLMGELMLGRRGQSSPPLSMRRIALESGGSAYWAALGYLGVLSAVIILSYYCIIGGETLVYAIKSIRGDFVDIAPELSLTTAADYSASWPLLLGGHTVFLGLVVMISARGVAGGVEQAVKYMMPALFIILIMMVVYAGVAGDFGETLRYLFAPDFGKLNATVVIEAFGQAFFSIGVGVTILMAYGSYLHREDSVSRSSLIVVGADTVVALLAGFAIFPIVFAYGLDAGGGPALVFETVPLAFGHMPAGWFFGSLFFILLAFAAMTSAICILEAPVAWLTSLSGWSRSGAAMTAGAVVWLLGLLPVLSMNVLAGVHPLGFLGIEMGFFDLFDYTATNILLPMGGLFMAVFLGWVVPERILHEEFETHRQHRWFRIWIFLMRYLVPLVLLLVFINLLWP